MTRATANLPIVLLVALTLPSVAAAEPRTGSSPFEVTTKTDLPVMAISGGLWMGGLLGQSSMVKERCTDCAPSFLSTLDRSVLDNHSPSAAPLSDALMMTAVGAPFIANAIDAWANAGSDPDPLGAYLTDAVVLTEALLITGMLNQAAKLAFQRPRPYTHSPGGSRFNKVSPDASLSFYSGHTAIAFTAAVSYSYLFQARHPDSPMVAPVWIGSLGVASTVGYLRVQAGKHYWSDVLVGAVAGAAVGYLVPALHTRGPDWIGDVEIRFGAGTSDHGSPLFTMSGAF